MDIILVGIMVSILFILAMSAYVVIFKNASFDPSSIGEGIATTLGGGGFGYWTKRLGDKKQNQGGSDNGGTNSLTELFKG
jgi:hypothetical protein